MGTFGTGPFSSDGALDLLEELGELPKAERRDELARRLSAVVEGSPAVMHGRYADEVVAAAALVAISLPGGDRILNAQPASVADELMGALLSDPAIELARPALAALESVAGSQGSWFRGWIDAERQTAAEQVIEDLRLVLEGAVS